MSCCRRTRSICCANGGRRARRVTMLQHRWRNAGCVERRLAAILAADVAGYSRLIEADEEGTLSRLKALRAELIDPKIAVHRGRIVKTTGDGLLVEFASVVDAVRCAAEMQAAMAERHAPLPPDRRIDFRIGINVGDIAVEDGDRAPLTGIGAALLFSRKCDDAAARAVSGGVESLRY